MTGCIFRERVALSRSINLVGGTIDATGLGVPLQQGALSITGSDVTVAGVNEYGSGGAGVQVTGSRVTVRDSRFHDNIQEGYSVSPPASDLLFLRVRFDHNNAARTIDPGWEAGGGKAHGTRITFDTVESDHNGGPGIWFDQWYPAGTPVSSKDFNSGAVVRNCRVHDNQESGIMYEVSDGATITGNAVWSNGNPSAGWYWAAGILVSSSRNVTISGNTLYANLDGISVLSQNRSDRPGSTTNVLVRDNSVIQDYENSADTSDKSLLAWAQDWSGGIYDAASANSGAGDRFWSPYPEPRYARYIWLGSQDTIAKFNATPGEDAGANLSQAQRDTALAAAGIPLLH